MICKKCNQVIKESEVLTLVFEFGAEGGGSEVFRTKDEKIIISGSSGGMLDEDEDPFIQWSTKYRLWTSFWSQFKRGNKHWYNMYPRFIHDDYKSFIKQELLSLDVDHDILSKWFKLVN